MAAKSVRRSDKPAVLRSRVSCAPRASSPGSVPGCKPLRHRGDAGRKRCTALRPARGTRPSSPPSTRADPPRGASKPAETSQDVRRNPRTAGSTRPRTPRGTPHRRTRGSAVVQGRLVVVCPAAVAGIERATGAARREGTEVVAAGSSPQCRCRGARPKSTIATRSSSSSAAPCGGDRDVVEGEAHRAARRGDRGPHERGSRCGRQLRSVIPPRRRFASPRGLRADRGSGRVAAVDGRRSARYGSA